MGLQSIPSCSFSPEDKCSAPSTVCVQLCPAEDLSLLFPMGSSYAAKDSQDSPPRNWLKYSFVLFSHDLYIEL